jgi:hypothetical protein
MEEKERKEINIERTGKGFPALWEEGGAMTNTSTATILATSDGKPKKALYIRRHGKLSNDRHALFVIEKGDLILHIHGNSSGDFITVSLLVDISEKTATTVLLYKYSNGEWDNTPPEYLKEALNSLKEKGRCYHCREMHFGISPTETI